LTRLTHKKGFLRAFFYGAQGLYGSHIKTGGRD
jgi:hypothetical protein